MKGHTFKSTTSFLSAMILVAAGFIAAPASAATPGAAPSEETVSAPALPSFDITARQPSVKYTRAQLDRIGGDPRIVEYWTPERMANAIPLDGPRTSPALDAKAVATALQAVPEVAEKSVAEAATADSVAGIAPLASAVNKTSRKNGKVFFRDARDGKDYVCSGAAINSASKRLVATAGHCVHGGKGGTWHRNWVFVPSYKNGSQPYGYFTAKAFRTYGDWITYGATTARGLNSDVAFVTTYMSKKGKRVVKAVGGHGLSYGGSRIFSANIFGYPTNLSRGETQKACAGKTSSRAVGGYSFPSVSGCNFGGGSSGGPWLASYNSKTGVGNLRSVTSFGPINSNSFIAGPYFDKRITALYKAANGDW
ncbi:MAG: hypothetical protein QM705_01840 [Ancrocorticia sp.]